MSSGLSPLMQEMLEKDPKAFNDVKNIYITYLKTRESAEIKLDNSDEDESEDDINYELIDPEMVNKNKKSLRSKKISVSEKEVRLELDRMYDIYIKRMEKNQVELLKYEGLLKTYTKMRDEAKEKADHSYQDMQKAKEEADKYRGIVLKLQIDLSKMEKLEKQLKDSETMINGLLNEKKMESNKFTLKMRDTCAICTEPHKDSEDIVSLVCKHMYHDKCINTWLETKQNCPECRQKI